MKYYLQSNIKRQNFDKGGNKAEVGSICSAFLNIYKGHSTVTDKEETMELSTDSLNQYCDKT